MKFKLYTAVFVAPIMNSVQIRSLIWEIIKTFMYLKASKVLEKQILGKGYFHGNISLPHLSRAPHLLAEQQPSSLIISTRYSGKYVAHSQLVIGISP